MLADVRGLNPAKRILDIGAERRISLPMKVIGVSPVDEFQKREPKYKRVLEESQFVLERGLNTEGVKYHSIATRIKSFDSRDRHEQRQTIRYPLARHRHLDQAQRTLGSA
jgi:hypothetical protein